jgi:hypothetical protein
MYGGNAGADSQSRPSSSKVPCQMSDSVHVLDDLWCDAHVAHEMDEKLEGFLGQLGGTGCCGG